MHNPQHRHQHQQHARAAQAQRAGQMQQRERQINRIAAEPEHTAGDQRPGGAVRHHRGTGARQLQQGSEQHRDRDQRQGGGNALAAGKCRQRPVQRLIQAVADQQAAQVEEGWRHTDFGMFQWHDDLSLIR
tara:strand:+ start:2599 stop:2991 length:393 start_codon:yes stop_codon:yes gene_type:complete